MESWRSRVRSLDHVMDVAEAARRLGRTAKAIRRLREKGRLSCQKVDGRVHFREEDIQLFLEGEVPANAQTAVPEGPGSVTMAGEGRAGPQRTRGVRITVRPYNRGTGGWEVDIPVQQSSGEIRRKRLKSPKATEKASHRWGLEKWAEFNGYAGMDRDETEVRKPKKPKNKNIPTLEQFAKLPEKLEGLGQCRAPSFGARLRSDKIAPSTFRGYRSKVNARILPVLGHLHLDEIGTAELLELRDEMTDYSAKYCNHAASVLHRILVVAAKYELIDESRIPSVEMLKLDEQEFVVYPPDELARMAEVARGLDPRCLGVLALGADGGLRAGEMAGLHGEDCRDGRLRIARSWDWVERRAVATKNRKARVMRQTLLMEEALAGLPRRRGEHVLRRDDGSPCTYRELRSWLREVQEAAKVETAGVHALRHTFATNLLEAGVQPQVVMKLGGWSSLKMVERYTHVVDRHTSAAIDALNQLRKTAATRAVFGEELGDANSLI